MEITRPRPTVAEEARTADRGMRLLLSKQHASSAALWGAVGLATLTVAVRGGMLALAPGAPAADPDGYRYLAQNLLEHGTYGYGEITTAYRPPLYPLLLAGCLALGGSGNLAIGLLHLALGLATVWLVYRLGRQWGLGSWALLAAALVAFDPILLAQSAQVMTETLAACLAALSLLALTWVTQSPEDCPSFREAKTGLSPSSTHSAPGDCPSFREAKTGLSPSSTHTSPSASSNSLVYASLAGASLALATLCRATFLPWMILAALILPAFAQTWRRRLKVLGAFVACAAVVMAPWAARNQIRFGRPIVATTHGGYTLLLGNNPSFYRYLRSGKWGTVWDADAFNRQWRQRAIRTEPADELRNDRLAYTLAWHNIRSEPSTFLYSCLVRTGRLWALMPHQVDPHEGAAKRSSRYLVGLWYLAEFLLAVAGLIVLSRGPGETRWWRAPWLWAVLLAASFTAVHALYWTNMRMRAPLVPVIALAAALGAARVFLRTGSPFSRGKTGD